MSGHSKWATIKHQKGAKDKARGKLFAKLIRQLEVAAREGGGDVDANPTLRTMFQKARDASVPMDTIERAIKRGTGELEGVTYEQITYEGYAPGGVAWQFDRKGQVLVDRKADEDELMMVALDAGADDLADDGELWRVMCPPAELHKVRTAIEQAGMAVDSSDLTMVPQNTIPLTDGESAKKVLRLIDTLDEHDDVQNVHANFDIPDAIIEAVEA